MTRLFRLRFDPTDRRALERIARHLAEGGLVAYPTETVYGLGSAVRPREVERLRALKGGERRDPFLVLVSSAEAVDLAWTGTARALADAFWPGPLTLVLADPRGRYPDGVRSRSGGVAVRVSPHSFPRALAGVWSEPILSTSANRSGRRPAANPDEVERELGEEAARAGMWLIDGGTLSPSAPSTVLDCLDETPRVIREGAIPLSALREVAPRIIEPS